ncbi:hypothetical protein [Legionella parisiensis]|uniref:Uncharacterized protein n=1 Tax=Legionella parisiensis TaxID=45071 RepID=A0A1E5JPH1_9GAMM|nr:hypothetical protein [Legionella parisiensis]KTD42065.1 hypothetical protein Lpar_3382 [Legionella parisiensis]OEH46434.1 hypothetical protein lpari_02773 [Legionella parisiensis]STX75410.1 Uncharacterised protein [Legionella parisiensis]
MQNKLETSPQIEETQKKRIQLLSKVQQLPTKELNECFAFWLGNDPIKKGDLESYKTDKPFVFVGTSIFGAVALACDLGEKVSCIPQVIIVDLSPQVANSWDLIKTYFGSSTETSPTSFVNGFIQFLKEKNIHQFSMDIYDDESFQQLRHLLMDLMEKYGFTRVKEMTNDAIILKQSWAHKETFQQIREVYADLNIYAYPSNIIHSIGDLKTQKDVAQCVEILKPVLSIQTNLDNGEPQKVHLIENNTTLSIMRALGPGPFLKEEEQLQFNNEFYTTDSSSFFYQPAKKQETKSPHQLTVQDII